jgi:hypothetical protein
MKKKITILSILTLLVLLTSCGYKKVNQKDNDLIHIQNINVTGEQRIAYTLKNNILLISNLNSKNKYDAELEIKKIKTDKNKDKTGKVTRFNLSISAALLLKNSNNSQEITKYFVQNQDYDLGVNHSDTINAENNTTKNIIQKLSDDITNFITLRMTKL